MNFKLPFIQITITTIILYFSFSYCYSADPLTPGDIIPEFQLENVNNSDESGKYLRIEKKEKFSWQEISSKLIIMEFFSVFCTKCYKNVPIHNKLFKIINNDKKLDKDIKMLGVGLMSTPEQVDVFQKKFNVQYPLFADINNKITMKTNINAFPQTVVIDKNGKVIMSHPGVMKDLDSFLEQLREHYKEL